MRRMSKKGQAAMEFLMTYGWAILIAIIAIAALIAFGVLNPSVQETCGTGGVITQGVSCDLSSIVIKPTGGEIVITNNLDSTVSFSAMTVTAKGGMTCTSPTEASGDMAAGTTGGFTLACTGLIPGKALDATFVGTYTVNLQTFPVTFKLVKKVANA